MTILGLKFQFRFEHYDLYPKSIISFSKSIFFFLNKTLKRHRFFNFFGKKKKIETDAISSFKFSICIQKSKL